jgi:hypothetical protein
MVSSRNSLKTPSWSIPASSNPCCNEENITRIPRDVIIHRHLFVDEFHSNDAFQSVARQHGQLPIPILRRKNTLEVKSLR